MPKKRFETLNLLPLNIRSKKEWAEILWRAPSSMIRYFLDQRILLSIAQDNLFRAFQAQIIFLNFKDHVSRVHINKVKNE